MLEIKNKKIFIVLLIVAIGVWSIAVYRFYNSRVIEKDAFLVSNNVKSLHSNTKTSFEPPGRDFMYRSSFKDPFGSQISRRKKSNKIIKVVKVIKTIEIVPTFELKGVIYDGVNAIALIKAENGEIFYVREDDKIGDAKILSINPQLVKYLYNNKEYSMN